MEEWGLAAYGALGWTGRRMRHRRVCRAEEEMAGKGKVEAEAMRGEEGGRGERRQRRPQRRQRRPEEEEEMGER
uniref:Uncharacterized protein n=1 Tax=Arundo donax TaxID=35708 RepID=A0A0A9DBY6_ARUDO